MIANILTVLFIGILTVDGFMTGTPIHKGKLNWSYLHFRSIFETTSGYDFSSVLEITADVSARCPTDLTHWLDYCETYLQEDSPCGYGKWYHGNYTIQPPKCVHT